MSIKKIFYKIYKFPFIFSIFYRYMDTFIQIYIANIIGDFFNSAIEGRTKYILDNSISFIIIIFLIMLIQGLIALYVDFERQKKKYSFKGYLYEGFLDNPLIKAEDFTTGEIQTRLEKDVDKVISALDASWGIIIACSISAITYVIYMGRVNLTVTLIIFSLGFLPLLAPLALKKSYAKTSDEYYKTEDEISGYTKETIDGFEHIKLNNLYLKMEKGYYSLQKKVGKTALAMEKVFLIGQSMNEGFKNTAVFSMYGILGYCVYKKIINPGEVVLMLLLSKKLYTSLNSVFEQYENLVEADVSIERISEMLPKDSEIETIDGSIIDDIYSIDLSDIGFKHDERTVLEGVSLSVKKGDKILITGANGSGKSTIIKILLGLYKDFNGEVKINGVKINNLNMKSYRNHIAWVPQEQFFYPGDALSNMTLFKKEGYNECATALEVDRDILKDRSCESLSGGQRQRINLVRGFLKDGGLFILDEPSNYLDEDGIKKLKEIIKNSKKTIIAITHDEKLMDVFDSTYRLNDGKLMEVINNEK